MSSWFDYFSQHQDYVFFAVGGICVLIESGLLKFSGPFIFLAIGSLLTGVFISFGFITDFTTALVICAGFTGASAGLLRSPLKHAHAANEELAQEALGRILLASSTITAAEGRVFYEDSEWLARLENIDDAPIHAGSQVVVRQVDGVLLMVSELSMS